MIKILVLVLIAKYEPELNLHIALSIRMVSSSDHDLLVRDTIYH